MQIYLYLSTKLYHFSLPTETSGSFSFDIDEEEVAKLINVEARENDWVLYSTSDCQVIQDNFQVEAVKLEANKFYCIRRKESNYLISTTTNEDYELTTYHYDESLTLSISDQNASSLIYRCPFLNGKEIKISYTNKQLILENKDDALIYLNNQKIHGKSIIIKEGDAIFLFGLKLIFLPRLLLLYSPRNEVSINDAMCHLQTVIFNDIDAPENIEVKDKPLYQEKEYFSKAPRMRRSIETKKIKLSPPPQSQKDQELPLILTIGPMLTMGIMSGVTLTNTIYKICMKETTLAQSWPSLVVSLAMLISMILWPTVTKIYNKKMKKKAREEVIRKYDAYLNDKRKELNEEKKLQKDIIMENLITVEECCNIIQNKTINFWDKRIDQNDFLEFRLGIGNAKLDMEIEYAEEDFSVEDNELRKKADALVAEYEYIENVPIGYSFFENRLTAIMGNQEKIIPFIHNILLQLLTFYTYEDVKVVVFTNEERSKYWEFLKYLNHTFDNTRYFRLYATTQDTAKNLSEYLNYEVATRKNYGNDITIKPHYFVIIDDYDRVKRQSFIKEISETEENLGFSLIILENKMNKLPSKCNNFINIGDKNSGILKNSYEDQEQIPLYNEINTKINMNILPQFLSNIPIEFEADATNLPEAISFLEMEKVGKVEQLNILNRWNMNDATSSLRAEIGVGEDGDLMYLDLHEKSHGPHGLIAGMTGSGKSEFIITYILAMAINYSPDDVSFILIDYKGGGLAFAFSNPSSGVVLPHVAGTITNLDEAEMDRTLVSIESEAKRRQNKFNEAKDLLGESTLDIYKYQRYYKEGKLSEAIPHLFIVCDEFAELKSQQPDFMDNLISIARIGRSLGIHLILATQKPSGVVNDQIWSNSKFHICLKVQDQSDSQEMLKKPDAALLKQTGRFYLQVGYDEYFALGQSAWCGAKYYPSDKIIKQVDKSVNFIDDNAMFIRSIQMDNGVSIEPQGEQIAAIMKSIIKIAEKEGKKAAPLWLENIQEIVTIYQLVTKYNVSIIPYEVKAIIGEYDAPEKQEQGLLSYNMKEEGNTIIYSTDTSDSEMLVNTIILSTTMLHKVEEINYYILDYGSQFLRRFSRLPHIGGIVFPGEEEKYHNLFKMIREEIDYRKNILAEYGGEYKDYIKNTENKLPLMVVVLNNFDAINEADKKLYDEFPDFVRGSERYGIIYILTVIGPTSVPRKIAQNFSNSYALKVKEAVDYMTIFNVRKKIIVKDIKGRGIFLDDTLYEFQTASITDQEDESAYIDQVIENVRKNNTAKAKKIPELPDQVTFDDVDEKIKDLSQVPIGINVGNLEINTYDFENAFGSIITGNKVVYLKPFLISLLEVLKEIPNTQIMVLDASKILEQNASNITNYYKENYSNILKALINYVNKKRQEGTENEIVLVIGVMKLLDTLENKKELEEFFKAIKQYEKAHIVIAEEIGKLKKCIYETWYTTCFDTPEGIYIGSGVGEQAVLKISNYTQELNKQYNTNMGFHIAEGTYKLVKLIEFEREEEESE